MMVKPPIHRWIENCVLTLLQYHHFEIPSLRETPLPKTTSKLYFVEIGEQNKELANSRDKEKQRWLLLCLHDRRRLQIKTSPGPNPTRKCGRLPRRALK